MPTDTLQDFVEARLRAYDPLIDLTTGSPAQEQVVDPIVRRFQPDPLEMSVEQFILARLAQEVPEMNTAEGTGVRDFLVKPNQILMDPVLREVQLIKQGQSLANPELLADAEADALVANFFVSRSLGNLSKGRVRLYFNAPVAINITIGNVCYTADGLRYLPTTLQSISAEAMVFNTSGNLYYFDISVTAEAAGDNYNIPNGRIVGITNLSVSVRATNLAAFSDGLPREDTSTLVSRAEQSVTERSLVVPRGTIARLQDQFNDLKQIQIIGTGDVEMQRDLIVGGDLGSVLLSGNDGFAVDDGKGGTTTTRFSTLFEDFTEVSQEGAVAGHYLEVSIVAQGTDGRIDPSYLSEFRSDTAKFTEADIGAVITVVQATNPANRGTFKVVGIGAHVINSALLQTVSGAPWVGVAETGIVWALLRGQGEHRVDAVLSSKELRLVDPINVSPYAISWSLRKKELTLSNIPGGVIFGEQANTMQSDEVHVGGCTDFYVRGTGTSTQLLPLQNLVDESPLVSSETGVIDHNSSRTLLFDSKVNFVSSGVQPGMWLRIKSSVAGNAGTYKIVRVGVNPSGSSDGALSPSYLQVDYASMFLDADDSGISYDIQASVTVDLLTPKNAKGSGSLGSTVQLSNVFSTTNSIDFGALGVGVGDILRISNGTDAGDYSILEVAGTANKNLILSRSMLSTAVNVRWEVFSVQTGMSLPLVKIDKVDLLDGGMSPTGYTVPYADPVDSRSTAFSNVAHGTKVSITEACVGIVGTVDLSGSFTLGPTELHVLVGNSSYHITLTGSTSATEIVDRINAAVPMLARIIYAPSSTGTAAYLSLGSRDRYVLVFTVDAGIGLVAGDDSRQIKASPTTDIVWSDASYDLRAGADVVSIAVGEDVGNFYLVKVEAGRLLVVGFDEDSKDVRFLTPCLGASLSVGSRSTGSARVYFLEPTSFEVRGSYRPALNGHRVNPNNTSALLVGEGLDVVEKPVTYFSVKDSPLRFVPDPTLSSRLVLNETDAIPNNLTIGSVGLVTSEQSPAGDLGKGTRTVDISFLGNGVSVGDIIDITYQPIQGTLDLATPPSMAGHTLTLKVDGVVRTVTFVEVGSCDEIAAQINEAVNAGVDIASITSVGDFRYLKLEADFRILVVSGGAYLGITQTDNRSYAADNGPYHVIALSNIGHGYDTHPNQVVIVDKDGQYPIAPPAGMSNQAHHFTISRAGVQRIHTTAMAANKEYGLYYMDVELVSDGSGDSWNIPEGMVMLVTGHTSDGYSLIVADPNLSYSIREKVKMRLSNTILVQGQSDRKSAATPITHANIQLTYQQSPLVSSVQSFAAAELDRVLTASILVRHLQPAYVNFDMNYSGGSSESVVTDDVNGYLAGLSPNDRVESSSVQNFPKRRGATYVANPITLLAVTHDENRKIVVDRSTDYVSHSRLSTFFPGVINITKS